MSDRPPNPFLDETSDAAEMKRRRTHFYLQVAAIIGFLALALLYLSPGISIEALLERIQEGGIVVFYASFVVLTIIGVPSTPFYLLAGAVFPLWQNLLVSAIAIAVHFALAWWLSARLMRSFLLNFLGRRGIRVPAVTRDNEWRVSFLVKFTPGLAMFIKSYVLGVAGVRFSVFMVVSCVATYIFAAAFLTMGRSAMEGSTGLFLGGVALLVFAAALLRILKKRARAKRANTKSDEFGA